MLKDRKFNVSNIKETETTLEIKDKVVAIFMYTKPKKQNFLNYLKKYSKYNHIIFVYKSSITNPIRTSLLNMDKKIELFNMDSVQFNVTKFHLQPKKISKFTGKIDKNILPKILLSDPIVKYYDFKLGDVIEFERINNYKYYRLVSFNFHES